MNVISGTVYDASNNLAPLILVRAFRRDTGMLLGETITGASATPMPGDAHWDKVIVLVPCAGESGATTFTDVSPLGHTVFTIGNASISKSNHPDGALHLSRDGGYVTITGRTSSLEPLNNDITIDLRFFASTTSGNQGLLSFYNDYHLGIGLWGNHLAVGVSRTGNSWFPFTPDVGGTAFIGDKSITPSSWHTLSLERYNNLWTLYVDNSIDNQISDSSFVFPRMDNLNIGAWGIGSGIFYGGDIRDFRYTRHARWRGTHDPELLAFPHGFPDYGLGKFEIPIDYSGTVDLRYYSQATELAPDLINTVVVP